MKNIAFVINPISGTHNKRKLPKLIQQLLDHEQWNFDIRMTERPGHATELAQQYAQMGFDAVVACGGDGTVHEVACGLRDTNTALGIIPLGSGNGLARHLQIPMKTEKAIALLNFSEVISADYGLENGRPFFCTCGTGFDAYISKEFAENGKRGLKTYIQEIIKGYFSYKPQTYRLLGEGVDLKLEAFVVTIANANQWGNNAIIAPQASIQDGMLDICVLSPFPLIAAPHLALKLFTKTMDKGLFMHTVRTRQVVLHREAPGVFHFDGEPCDESQDIMIEVKHDGLKLLVARRF